jgi:hypothetical protein
MFEPFIEGRGWTSVLLDGTGTSVTMLNGKRP